MTQKVIILQGLPASGKSTWARAHVLANPGWKRINRDELRRMVDAGKYSKSNEKLIRQFRDDILRECLSSKYSIIIDDTNFEQYQIDHIREIAREFDVPVEKKIFYVDPVECIKRNDLRSEEERVPESVIWEMYEKYVKPNEYKESTKLVQDYSLPHAIIVDLDGTLAIHNGRSPYECEKAGDDLVNDAVYEVLLSYTLHRNNPVIFMSGRNERCRVVTENWLNTALDFALPYQLFMRADGDNRKDSVVKLELFNNHIRDKYYIDFVLDDRDQVVDMWRNILGLPCFQVNYGAF